jgi:hypothetical protein
MVIIFMIGTLSMSSFLIPIYELGERSSINLTLLLTVVAFKLLLSDNLPKVSYFTFLDTYVLSAFVFIFTIAVVNTTLAFLTGIQDTASCAPENALVQEEGNGQSPHSPQCPYHLQDRDCEPPTEAYCEPYNHGLYRLPFFFFLSTPACWTMFQFGGAWSMADAIAFERYESRQKTKTNAKDSTRQDVPTCGPCVT